MCLVNKFSISIVNIKALIVNALALVSIVVFSIWSFAINKYWLNNNISCRYFPSAVITHNYSRLQKFGDFFKIEKHHKNGEEKAFLLFSRTVCKELTANNIQDINYISLI